MVSLKQKKGGDKMQKKKEKIRVFRIVVAAVIIKEKTVLLLQRRTDAESYPGVWEFPSGKREFNETSVEALIREAKEEIGCSIVVKRPISVFEYIVETPTEIRNTTQINFLAQLANPNEPIKINPREHQAAHWFTKEELLSLKEISKEVRNCALLALELEI